LHRFLGSRDEDGALLRDGDFLPPCVEAVREQFRQGLDAHMEEWRIMTAKDIGLIWER
jgi:hypothetical protein